MRQSAILIVSIFYCAFFIAQDLRFSRNFQTIKKNVPLAIINNSPDYFFVLRYNKLAHDLVVERRRKSNAEMINIQPLKMDSVNARTFNYENLDYLFFADKDHGHLVFEKVTTNRRSVYIKSFDTSGHAGAFIQLASMDRSNSYKDFYFSLKETVGGKVMIISTKVFHDNSINRIVYLYDVARKKFTWEKKLPHENEVSGYAQGFTTDHSGDLYYFVVSARLLEYRRQSVNYFQRIMPVYHYDSISLKYVSATEAEVRSKKLQISDFSRLNGLHLFQFGSSVVASVYFSSGVTSDDQLKGYFLGQGFRKGLTEELYSVITPLKKEVSDKLEFFDGGDTKDAADKTYQQLWHKVSGSSGFQLSGREEENFSKEMIFWATDLNSGRVVSQAIVPRKIFYFSGRTRFKNMGLPTCAASADTAYTFVLEHVSNEKVQPKDFNYSKFQKQEYASYANLACYYFIPGAEVKKKVILKNIDYDCIPLNYKGDQRDVIFFQSRVSVERFVILKLNQF